MQWPECFVFSPVINERRAVQEEPAPLSPRLLFLNSTSLPTSLHLPPTSCSTLLSRPLLLSLTVIEDDGVCVALRDGAAHEGDVAVLLLRRHRLAGQRGLVALERLQHTPRRDSIRALEDDLTGFHDTMQRTGFAGLSFVFTCITLCCRSTSQSAGTAPPCRSTTRSPGTSSSGSTCDAEDTW